MYLRFFLIQSLESLDNMFRILYNVSAFDASATWEKREEKTWTQSFQLPFTRSF